ncbi:hypothetical protein ACFWAY_22710 [Rhodococcus sp. NPDC059968]
MGLRTLRTFAKTWDVEVDEVQLTVELALADAPSVRQRPGRGSALPCIR